MYALLVFLVALQRLVELQISRSNEIHLRRRGAVEHGAGHYPVMVGLHTLWLIACLVERIYAPTQMTWKVLVAAWLMFLAGQYLRWTTIRTLKRRWTTRVIVLEGAELVSGGPFRWLNHPNYLGVCLEIVALPLIGGCWRSALFFGVSNLILLTFRVRIEERALRG